MMRMEIMEEFSGSSDQIVVKRKRTKRPRPSSSASSSGGGYAEFYINSSLQVSSSPATTSSGISTSTEEDEDMANCLILLARGMSSPPQPEEEIKAVAENKFSSRKFTEMATSTNGGRVGIYVYECKTCNRTFPSFQALGGHRASHKKPKTATDNDQKKSPPHTAGPLVDQQEEERKLIKINTAISPPPSTHSQNKSCSSDPNKPKIHECSICGAEFASGQALGGHMRRHRPAPKTTDSDTTSHDAGDKKPKNVFSLDLNLPAPQEDEKFSHQFPAKQQPHLVFSAAALVDCHY